MAICSTGEPGGELSSGGELFAVVNFFLLLWNPFESLIEKAPVTGELPSKQFAIFPRLPQKNPKPPRVLENLPNLS
jgi:hypothetical protein